MYVTRGREELKRLSTQDEVGVFMGIKRSRDVIINVVFVVFVFVFVVAVCCFFPGPLGRITTTVRSDVVC